MGGVRPVATEMWTDSGIDCAVIAPELGRLFAAASSIYPARAGYFSSDHAIRACAGRIWGMGHSWSLVFDYVLLVEATCVPPAAGGENTYKQRF